MCFSLETASDYVKDDKSCFYGFKCVIVGYEWTGKAHEVTVTVETEQSSDYQRLNGQNTMQRCYDNGPLLLILYFAYFQGL